MPVPKTSQLRFWRVARVVVAGAFVVAVLAKLFFSHGYLRSYAFDVVTPAWLYVEFRGLYAPDRSNWRTRLIGYSSERTALLLFVATAAAEAGQYFKIWTHLPGVFDIHDFIAYAVGIGACYSVDKVLTLSSPPNWIDRGTSRSTG